MFLGNIECFYHILYMSFYDTYFRECLIDDIIYTLLYDYFILTLLATYRITE